MSLFRATFTVGGLTAVSRILGFVRDILTARIIGAGWVGDCFVLAFKLPNFFRRLFAEGAFSAAFVPMFSSLLEGEGLPKDATPEERRRAAIAFTEQALSALLGTLLLFVTVCQVFMPWLMMLLGAGFLDNPEKYDLAVQLTRITFPYLLFISLVSLLGGVMNGLHRFAAVAFTPVLLNLCLIVPLALGLEVSTLASAHMQAVAVSVAGVVQFLWLVVACRREGINLRLRLPSITPQVKRLLTIMAPVALGAGAFQVSLMIDTFLASFLRDGSMSFLYYADRLNQLPLGVIGIAVGTALLPLLSRQVAAGDAAGAMSSQNRAIEMVWFLTLPAAAALVLMPETLVRVLFQGQSFNADMTHATAMALGAFALGLPAYVLAKVLTPSYFARKNTRTPVRYAMIGLGINVVLNVILMFPLAHVGLALATAIAAWVNAGLLYRGLIQRGHYEMDLRLKKRLPRILAATGVMLAALYGALLLLDGALHDGGVVRFSALAGVVLVGIGVYAAAAFGFGAITKTDLRSIRRR
ncbi:murein biosynthesis integral membrane protein MurJ [Govanella unica]|uniref:Probable lipid II flippase MurJ n=1 Tax=Govanella unica TaxID=2975056 RepID=A0A9X3TZ91_9PROT|nr:murein biosynthesis integral membrane protein MurJ [Govania unica]MDA5194675.1 murein biosynthesis integral membrane protein MurJ [Govania unica]